MSHFVGWSMSRQYPKSSEVVEKYATNEAMIASKYVAGKIAKIERVVEPALKLAEAGLPEEQVSSIVGGWQVEITREQLPLIRSVLGRVKVTNKVAQSADTLTVYVEPIKYPDITFTYKRKYKGDKHCKIVQKEKTITQFSLECENS